MQVIATHQASTAFAVQVAINNSGQYTALVRAIDADGTPVLIDRAQIALTEGQARFLANELYVAIRRGTYETKAARTAREAAEREQLAAERTAAYEASFTDAALRQVVANPIAGAPGPSRRAEILLTVPLFARKAVSARSHLLRNLRGGIGSWNLQCAVNEFRELGGDEAAAVALEARSKDDNARAMGWAV